MLWIGEDEGFGFFNLFLWVGFGFLGVIRENGKVVCIGWSFEFDVGDVFWWGFWDGWEVILFLKIYKDKEEVVFNLIFNFWVINCW